jgi:hypothetical protein
MGWILDCARATLRHFVALMGSALFNIAGVVGLLLHKGDAWLIRVSFGLGGFSLLLALALAWRDEHRELLDHIQLPKLLVTIKEVSVIPSRRSDVFILATIHNTSTVETLISKYRAFVEVTSGISYLLEGPIHDLDEYRRTDLDWSEEWRNRVRGVMTMSSLYYAINRHEPLKRGLPVEGWLHFKVEAGGELPQLSVEMIKSVAIVVNDSFSSSPVHVVRKQAPVDNPATRIAPVEVPS